MSFADLLASAKEVAALGEAREREVTESTIVEVEDVKRKAELIRLAEKYRSAPRITWQERQQIAEAGLPRLALVLAKRRAFAVPEVVAAASAGFEVRRKLLGGRLDRSAEAQQLNLALAEAGVLDESSARRVAAAALRYWSGPKPPADAFVPASEGEGDLYRYLTDRDPRP